MQRDNKLKQYIISLSGLLVIVPEYIKGATIAIFIAISKRILPFSEEKFLPESAVSLIVKDQRGLEPYMTFKVKCFFCDESEYGESWENIHGNNQCHDSLFNTCFANRTMAGRHETHILALYKYCDIDKCNCIDTAGWCYSDQCGSQVVRCCLDFKDSISC